MGRPADVGRRPARRSRHAPADRRPVGFRPERRRVQRAPAPDDDARGRSPPRRRGTPGADGRSPRLGAAEQEHPAHRRRRPELLCALREALIAPAASAIDAMVRRAVERGEIPADAPAAEFVSAQLLGVMRARPLLEGKYADERYLTRFVESAILPPLGLGASATRPLEPRAVRPSG
ncbi:TetR-like C-terminal domain-containing protein [Streptomyces sp. ML-6]|uniref:TetR-like C-terminal domain-containing protein n=1 Tax=Streptomyces sp. ML-6 TaxID=2982693 RepID=UPI0024C0C778|nr:TetR-like C-terminal domain-containing protein [Streptomyces sp. ML-6]MDK0523527.1 TetR/AcrR family transcriptional regulator C-terminal ligand-binding domain-containing protein [Streptomyces sp. ML-6]